MKKMEKKNICICGGGNLGHVIAAVLANCGHNVSVMSGKPDMWNKSIRLVESNKEDITGELVMISSDAEKVIPNADIILFTLAGMQNEIYLKKIAPFVKENAVVGSVFGSVGFYWIAKNILPKSIGIFSFQRVPFIARLIEYGKSAELKGRRDTLYIYPSDKAVWVVDFFKRVFDTNIEVLSTPLTTILTNSNPLLHPSRIVTQFIGNEKTVYAEKLFLYETWNDSASELYIIADKEFQSILRILGINTSEVPDVLTYYESTDIKSLTKKITSIKSLKNIYVPMKQVDGGFVIDETSRLFTEDIPYGTIILKSVALMCGIPTPNIDKIIYWGQKMMNKEYLIDGKLIGEDIYESGIPNNYGINSMEDLLNLK